MTYQDKVKFFIKHPAHLKNVLAKVNKISPTKSQAYFASIPTDELETIQAAKEAERALSGGSINNGNGGQPPINPNIPTMESKLSDQDKLEYLTEAVLEGYYGFNADFSAPKPKGIAITDFLTEPQIRKAMKLKTAQAITEQIILPNIKEINKKLGQENDPKYLGYVCEFIISQLRH